MSLGNGRIRPGCNPAELVDVAEVKEVVVVVEVSVAVAIVVKVVVELKVLVSVLVDSLTAIICRTTFSIVPVGGTIENVFVDALESDSWASLLTGGLTGRTVITPVGGNETLVLVVVEDVTVDVVVDTPLA